VLKILEDKNYNRYLSVEIFREEYWREEPEEISRTAYKTLIDIALKSRVSIS